MQIGTNEGSFPVAAGIRWAKTYHAVVATPVRVHELFSGLLSWAAARIVSAAALFAIVAAVAGAFLSPLAALTPFAAVLCGLAFAAPMAALAGGVENHAGADGRLPLPPPPHLPLLRHVLPDRSAARLARAGRLGDAALAWGRALPRPRDRRDRGAADARPRRVPRRRSRSPARCSPSASSPESCSREHRRRSAAPHPALGAARGPARLPQRRRRPAQLAAGPVGLLRAGVLPARHRPRRGRARRGRELRRRARSLQGVRGPGDAGGVGDERRRLRVDDQRLREAQVDEDVRRRPRHAARDPRRRARRADLRAHARRHLRGRLRRGHARNGPRSNPGGPYSRYRRRSSWVQRSRLSGSSA